MENSNEVNSEGVNKDNNNKENSNSNSNTKQFGPEGKGNSEQLYDLKIILIPQQKIVNYI